MFETNSITHNDFGKSKVISKTISLGNNLTLFISGSSKDHNFVDFLLNKILDYSIDKISLNNTYKDFSSVLENVNSVLKTWNCNPEESVEMNMFIGVLNGNSFLFSNIGKSSCYLIKKNNVIEITDKKEKKKEFSYISNGELEHKDIITFSTKRLFNFLSESDFIDSYNVNIENFNSAIQEILNEESYEKNISIISLIYKSEQKEIEENNPKIDYIKNISLKIADTNFVKRIIAYYLILKENLKNKGNLTKKIGLAILIIILISLLYSIIHSSLSKKNDSKSLVENQKILDEATKAYLKASESLNNKDIFKLNIDLSEKNLKILKEKKLYLKDTKFLQEKISQLKKSVNGIESFQENENNEIANFKKEDSIKLLSLNRKTYIVGKKSIYGPLIKGTDIKEHKFENIGDDFFIDATTIGNEISLITNKGKVVIFKKNGNFNFIDVKGQKKWEESNTINSYRRKIYLISKEEGQIYMHKKSGNFFAKASPYIKPKDQADLKGMIDIAIDGGFYILKKDLSIVKFFSTSYTFQSLSLNNLPENYDIEDKNSPIKLKTNPNLNYVYMLLNNRILIFKPNKGNYINTKSLNYIGQIEGISNKIIDFNIPVDKEITILTKNGVYKVNFEVEDNKLIIR